MSIQPYLQGIYQTIGGNDVTIITAPTGSGKSIGVPNYIAQSGNKIFITVPTIAAARSLAAYQRTLQPSVNGQAVGVGFAADGIIEYDDNDYIIYTTAGHMRNKLLAMVKDYHMNKRPPSIFTNILMVDEIHTGSLDNYLILSLWRWFVQNNLPVPRLVLATATFDIEDFRAHSYKSNMLRPLHGMQPQPQVKIVTIPLAVRTTVSYTKSDYELHSKKLYADLVKTVVQSHIRMPAGHFLIFVPGQREIETVYNLLQRQNLQSGEYSAILLRAHGSLDAEDLQMIFAPVYQNERKIIIATNVAESSITISDIILIIDSMREKISYSTPSGGFRLNLNYISQSSAKQRCGRTGRTNDGLCIRMCTAHKFAKLPTSRPAEIKRIPLQEAVMQAYDAGLEPTELLHGAGKRRLTESISLLNNLAMLTSEYDKGSYKSVVTELGRFAAQLPIGVRSAGFLWGWLHSKRENGTSWPVYPGVVLTALIDSYDNSYFYYPPKNLDESMADYRQRCNLYRRTYFLQPFMGRSDIHVILNIWLSLLQYLQAQPDNIREETAVRTWARESSINHRKIREVIKIIAQLTAYLQRRNYTVEISLFNVDNVVNVARPILKSVYSTQIMKTIKTRAQNRSLRYRGLDKQNYALENRYTANTFATAPPMEIIALITHSRGGYNYISLALDLPVTPLVDQPRPQVKNTPHTPIVASPEVESLNIDVDKLPIDKSKEQQTISIDQATQNSNNGPSQVHILRNDDVDAELAALDFDFASLDYSEAASYNEVGSSAASYNEVGSSTASSSAASSSTASSSAASSSTASSSAASSGQHVPISAFGQSILEPVLNFPAMVEQSDQHIILESQPYDAFINKISALLRQQNVNNRQLYNNIRSIYLWFDHFTAFIQRQQVDYPAWMQASWPRAVSRLVLNILNGASIRAVWDKLLEDFAEKIASDYYQVRSWIIAYSDEWSLLDKALPNLGGKLENNLVILSLDELEWSLPHNTYLQLIGAKIKDRKVTQQNVADNIVRLFLQYLLPTWGKGYNLILPQAAYTYMVENVDLPITELYAAPFDAINERYGALFDNDRVWGGLGNAQQVLQNTQRPRFYFINPPATEYILQDALRQMFQHLLHQPRSEFLYVFPYWPTMPEVDFLSEQRDASFTTQMSGIVRAHRIIKNKELKLTNTLTQRQYKFGTDIIIALVARGKTTARLQGILNNFVNVLTKENPILLPLPGQSTRKQNTISRDRQLAVQSADEMLASTASNNNQVIGNKTTTQQNMVPHKPNLTSPRLQPSIQPRRNIQSNRLLPSGDQAIQVQQLNTLSTRAGMPSKHSTM